jgi:hypothetical protein
MKTTCLAALVAASALAASAQTTFTVDLNNNAGGANSSGGAALRPSSSPVVNWDISTTAVTQTTTFTGVNTFIAGPDGEFSVTLRGYQVGAINGSGAVGNPALTNNLNARTRELNFNATAATNRYASGVTLNTVYQDLLFSPHIVVEFTGLAANTTFDARVFTWDSSASGMAAQRLYDMTAGGNNTILGDTVIVGGGAYGATVTGSANPNLYITSDFSSSILAAGLTSTAGGALSLRVSSFGMTAGVVNAAFGDNAKLNGFALTTIPEPSTYAILGGIAALAVAAWRRRRA